MSMNHDTKDSGCCGGSAKPAPQEATKPATKATAPDVKPPQNPDTTQPKSKSCCD